MFAYNWLLKTDFILFFLSYYLDRNPAFDLIWSKYKTEIFNSVTVSVFYLHVDMINHGAASAH